MPYAIRARRHEWSRSPNGLATAQRYRERKRFEQASRRHESQRAEFLAKGWWWSDEIYWSKTKHAKLRRGIIAARKAQLGCETCGESCPDVLHFREYVGDLADRVSGYRLLMAVNEAGRPLCLNCRRREQKPTDEVRLALVEIKARIGCLSCKLTDGFCLEFHHRVPSTKVASVSHLASKGLEVALAESQKCDVLCANCHAKHHREEQRLAA